MYAHTETHVHKLTSKFTYVQKEREWQGILFSDCNRTETRLVFGNQILCKIRFHHDVSAKHRDPHRTGSKSQAWLEVTHYSQSNIKWTIRNVVIKCVFIQSGLHPLTKTGFVSFKKQDERCHISCEPNRWWVWEAVMWQILFCLFAMWALKKTNRDRVRCFVITCQISSWQVSIMTVWLCVNVSHGNERMCVCVHVSWERLCTWSATCWICLLFKHTWVNTVSRSAAMLLPMNSSTILKSNHIHPFPCSLTQIPLRTAVCQHKVFNPTEQQH